MGEVEDPRGEPPAFARSLERAVICARRNEVDAVSFVQSETLNSGFGRVAVDSDERIGRIVDDPRHRFLQTNECALDGSVTRVGFPRRVDLVLPARSEQLLQCTRVLVARAGPPAVTEALVLVDEVANRFLIAHTEREGFEFGQSPPQVPSKHGPESTERTWTIVMTSLRSTRQDTARRS